MAHESKIEWTEATWNPWHGCHKVSQGCKNCYMFRDKARYGQDPNVVVRSKTKFYDPLKWTEPRTIFTCSWSDFFIEESDAWRDEAFAIMALTPQHTYQVLTKRPDRMLEYFKTALGRDGSIMTAVRESGVSIEREMQIREATAPLMSFIRDKASAISFPLPNVHLGVSVEDQKTADERIPLLLQTPAAVRWLSMEPLLGPVSVSLNTCRQCRHREHRDWCANMASDGDCSCTSNSVIDWVVAGGESGPDARPMHPDWVRSIRDQCTAASVPFFFKQWGEWNGELYGYSGCDDPCGKDVMALPDGTITGTDWEAGPHLKDGLQIHRVGKQKAGRTLDGRTWDEMPEVSS